MNYYYLISGLPDLRFGEEHPQLDTSEVLDTIQRNLEPADENIFRFLLYPIDNQNLLNAIFEDHKSISPFAFKHHGLFDKEMLKSYRRQKGFLPAYMGEFLNLWEEYFPTLTMWEIEEKLESQYYSEIEHQNCFFLSEYYAFKRKLKDLMAVFNKSYFNPMLSNTPESMRSLSNQVGKGKTPPASFFNDYPFLEEMDEVFARQDPLETDRFADRLTWEYLEETKGHFEQDKVFAYVLKLLIVDKWIGRDAEEGKKRFDELSSHIKSHVSKPKMTEV